MNSFWTYLDWHKQDAFLQEFHSWMQEHQTEHSWWFMRKALPHPHLRIRLSPPLPSDVQIQLLSGLLDPVWVPYEPEEQLFGGRMGMQLAHEVFQADTSFYVQHAKLAGAQEVDRSWLTNFSVKSFDCFLKAAGLEKNERWDCYQKMLTQRSTDVSHFQEAFIENRNAVEYTLNSEVSEYLDDQPEPVIEVAKQHIQTLEDIARRFQLHFAQGEISRGLRSIFCWIQIFNWNRLGLTPVEQAMMISFLICAEEPNP